MKKIISLFLILLVSVNVFTVSAFAETTGTTTYSDVGIMTLEEDDLINPSAAGTEEYPTWFRLQYLLSIFPYGEVQDGYTYNFDSYIMFFSKNGVNEDGTAKLSIINWDSSKSTVTMYDRNNLNLTYVIHTDNSGLNRKGMFLYTYNADTDTWDLDGSYSSYNSLTIGDCIFSKQVVYDTNSPETVYLEKGPTENYETWLIENDPNFDGWTDPDEEDLSWLEKVIEWFDKVKTAIEDLGRNIGSFFSDLGNMIQEKLDTFKEAVSTFFDNLGTKIGEFFTNLWGDIKGLFIPDENFMDEVLDNMNDFNDQSSFISAIRSFGYQLNELLHQDFDEPPTVYANLSAAESKYNYGVGKVNVLDFSWFAKYRKYTDPFLSAILWSLFLWALYKRLPDILNGAGFVTDAPFTAVESGYRGTYSEYKDNRKREAAYRERYSQDKAKERAKKG